MVGREGKGETPRQREKGTERDKDGAVRYRDKDREKERKGQKGERGKRTPKWKQGAWWR